MTHEYDVIIVGGGVTGTSLLYVLSRYTDIRKILLVEKYDDFALLNSNSSNNSQTLHFGDIETNYSEEHAKKTKKAAERLLRYTEALPKTVKEEMIRSCQKMVLAVGEDEVELIDKMYSKWLKELFPGLIRIDSEGVGKIEPNVVKGRKTGEKLAALLSDKGYMVDFGKLATSFANGAVGSSNGRAGVLKGVKIDSVERRGELYVLWSGNESYKTRFVVFATGAYSLFFAKSLGYDRNLSVLSIGGNFYYTPKVLNGKVYRVQIGGIPFAAVHGDPDITNPNITRFGPTVTVGIQLERRHSDTILDYLRTFDFDIKTLESLWNIFSDKDIRRILGRNAIYDIPFFGKHSFLKNEAAKIVPSIKHGDLKFANGVGGIRPQIIDEDKKSLILGAGKIVEDGAIFNITPSPGASSCLESALEDAITITKQLGAGFHKDDFENELGFIL